MNKAKEVISIFIRLFGRDNIEVLNTYETEEDVIVEFMLFEEVFFTSYIDKKIENQDILESEIKSQYDNAKCMLKDLLLKIDRFLMNEIM